MVSMGLRTLQCSQICPVDGSSFRRAVQIVSVNRGSEAGSGSLSCNSEVPHIICLKSLVCQLVLLRLNAFNAYVLKLDL